MYKYPIKTPTQKKTDKKLQEFRHNPQQGKPIQVKIFPQRLSQHRSTAVAKVGKIY